MIESHTGATAEVVASNLRSLRERSGLTRDELARQAGVSAAAVTRYEKAQRSQPAVIQLARLAAALGVTVDDLLRATKVA